MKKLLYSLLTLTALLAVASCQKEQPVDPYQDGDAVNASFSVYMGDAMTKAFADGTTVNTVDAALYEVGGTNDAPTYTFIAQADPAEIKDLKATVAVNGKLKKGKEYRMVFWAYAKAAATGSETAATTGADAGGTTAAASPYAVAWDPAPVVTVTPTGAANDEARDAFFGTFDTGVVMGDVTAEKDIPLVRPFSQVNVLVPVGNVTDGASVTSSMTVKQAPTVLNLNTKETSEPKDYVFAVAPMKEPAFGGYAQSHKYVAMNYILVDQDATASHYHDVAFSVTAGDDSTGDTPKSLTIPLKANVRTNIVGNIFESFGFSGGVVVTPGADEMVTTDIRIAVGTAGSSEDDPIPVSSNGELVTFTISRDVTSETPAITYDPEGIVTATWNPRAKAIEIVPQVENGSAVVTVTFAEVTKTTYAEGKVDVYVKVGTGETATAAAPTFSPEAGAVEAGAKVTISAEEGADIYFTTDGTDPTKESTKYTADTEITINEETTVKAIAVVNGKKNSPVATAAYTIKAALEQVAKPTFDPAAGEVASGTKVTIASATTGASIYYTTNGDVPTASSAAYTAPVEIAAACTLKAIAVKDGMTDSEVAEAAYTIAATPSTGSGTLEDPFTVAGVIAYIDGLDTKPSTNNVYVKGKVSSLNKDAFAGSSTVGYGTFFIKDEDTATESFEAYNVKYLDNTLWTEGMGNVAVGDEVVICGQVTLYENTNNNTKTYETYYNYNSGSPVAGYLYSVNGISKTLSVSSVSTTVDNTAKTIKVAWTSVENATAYSIACGNQTYTPSALTETEHTFTVQSYDTYPVTVTASADNYASTTATTSAKVSDPSTNIVYYNKVTSISSGKYLIVYETGKKALSSISTGGTTYGVGADVIIADNKIESDNTVDAYQIVISAASDNVDGHYIMKLGSAYLSWSSGNSLKTDTAESDNSRWTIVPGTTSGNFIITNVKDTTRQLWFNTGSPRFACYSGKTETTSGYSAVQLYKLTE